MARQRLFRHHLLASIDSISPLLPAVADAVDIALIDAVSLIGPPRDWPWRSLNVGFPPMLGRRSLGPCPPIGPFRVASAAARRFERMFVAPGVVVRPLDHPAGRFAIRPCGNMLGFAAQLGSSVVSAFGAMVMLKLASKLPETLAAAIPGRYLDQIVEHPVFAGRGYRALRVETDGADGLPILSFRAPPVRLCEAVLDAIARSNPTRG